MVGIGYRERRVEEAHRPKCMKKPANPVEVELLRKLINSGQTNLSEWLEEVCQEFCEDKATKSHSFVQNIKR